MRPDEQEGEGKVVSQAVTDHLPLHMKVKATSLEGNGSIEEVAVRWSLYRSVGEVYFFDLGPVSVGGSVSVGRRSPPRHRQGR